MNSFIRFAFRIISPLSLLTFASAQDHLGRDLGFFGGLVPSALLALVVLGVIVLLQTFVSRRTFNLPGIRASSAPDRALQILRERLASVEINLDDYEARRRVLVTNVRQQEQQAPWAMRLFRIGFAGVFFINALIAYMQPDDFLKLLEKSLATNWFTRLDLLIPMITLNDFAIAVVILATPKRYRPYVYAWTGLWFLAITVIKLLALNVFIS
jgi:uncharacterized membrane protein